jgi:hypothetical protein
LINAIIAVAGGLLCVIMFSVVKYQGGVVTLLLTFVLIILIVAIILRERKNEGVEIFHPLVFPAVFYFLPMFVLKPLAVLSLYYESNILDLLSDQNYYLNLGMITSILSFSSLTIGYHMPLGKRIGSCLPSLAKWNFAPNEMKMASLTVYGIGFLSTAYLFATGRIGYTLIQEGTITFLNILQHLSRYTVYGMFLALWVCLSLKSRRGSALLILLGIVLGQIWWTFAMGSRGYLFSMALIILGVRQYRLYPHVSYRKLLVPACFIIVSLLIGIILGTSFREQKLNSVGMETKINVGHVLSLNTDVLDKLLTLSISDIKEMGEQTIIRRMDSLDSLTVILNYSERLKPAEEAVGISGNIFTNLFWGFVPRFIWAEKPTISDFAIKFGNLYNISSSEFNFQAVTIMGDLYRNVGMAGVVLGMFIMGILLRTVYSWLMEKENPSSFSFCLYFFFITSINYEDQYSEVFTNSIRVILFLLMAGMIIRVHIRVKGILLNSTSSRKVEAFVRKGGGPK